MKISAFEERLLRHPQQALTLVLPDGGVIPAHFHITEAGRVDKSFIDCAGTVRSSASCSLQAWVADDVEHRLTAGKLAQVIKMAAPLFQGDDLEVEIEYEDGIISQFPVLQAAAEGETLIFQLDWKHTDCLAKDICLPQAGVVGECCSGSGCC